MGKGIRVKSNASAPNNAGIMGSGIFGMFGSTVHCKADDNSMFCTLSKFVNVIIMFFFLIMVFYLLYVAFNYFTKGKGFLGRKK
jgi:hypothetical protein